ncbi:PREDICTED: ubiquitin carboxyl-terminal hydrolase FAM188A-like [Branchiostoma belcheri]|uniref:Ubiquitin carboxyl-terminal hydrolase MINDY n=1 Tax=Branchiostoma belcheri TaxID=7741 RepID=A0A6P4ZLT8_BRABE|nr:PREDICTED: ubiquitin carboxyl-terminal hydrolase FAM188A-like [Branchiostoma belcheri]KAI8489950.1 hypothetical protein Bbelb_323110 [Branchiostoma belcheri]
MTESGQDEVTVPLEDLLTLVWGRNIRPDVFNRWSQGFEFSEDEPTALIQHEGGPCGIIVPLQASLLKNLLFSEGAPEQWNNVSADQAKQLLLMSLCEVFELCGVEKVVLVYQYTKKEKSGEEPMETGEGSGENMAAEEQEPTQDTGSAQVEGPTAAVDQFHQSLRMRQFSCADNLKTMIESSYEIFHGRHGVLLFLYSVILSKGIENIKNEVTDPTEPLIDSVHGHGSQSLINLLLTGYAVSHVWDGDQDVAGLKLRGIPRQGKVGFLTLLEHLRYCEVGSYLKNPEFPIWILGSETHLTVLFSKEMTLVAPESRDAEARRIFKSYDPEGNGFISTILLGDVLRSLDLCAEEEYVDIMQKKLDSEQLGIIVLEQFMQEFFANEEKSPIPESFTVYHYNGLKRSSNNGKVQYQEGKAMIQELGEVKCVTTDNSAIKTCLATKWPGVEVLWDNDISPSLN